MAKWILFREDFYKNLKGRHLNSIFLNPLIQTGFIFGGSTAAIILGRLIIYIIDEFRNSNQLNQTEKYISNWPGLDLFFFNGSILIMSFSILASTAYITSREMKINFFSVVPWILIGINAIVYSVFITEVNIDGTLNHNLFFKNYSNLVFWGSLILLYSSLIRDQWKKNAPELLAELGLEGLRNSLRDGKN